MRKAQIYPRGVMVAALDSKSSPVMGCRFKSGRGYKGFRNQYKGNERNDP